MLPVSTKLGPYEILSALGAGGMGEVYKARDTRLDRLVAIKILSATISADPDARPRFEREARTISQLSHPHICALYDVGEFSNPQSLVPNPYLVMELLDGETLADRVVKGALPVDEAIRYAAQIANALDKAHRAGIVHRDLKPANVMITKAGVKLLDFGLAKPALVLSPAAATMATVAASPPLTAHGLITGTIHYMAPEQLEGRPADARSDIYALGAVIYEMVTGTRAFNAPLQPLAPPMLDRVVRTCMAIDPDERWQSAHDVALQLAGAASVDVSGHAPARGRARWLPWAVAAGSVIVAAAAAAMLLRSGPRTHEPATVARFSIAPPAGGFYQSAETTGLSVSPDGSRIAFSASDASGVSRIWLRPVAALDAVPIAGTDGATALFWSPDGRSLAFFAAGKLRRVDVQGGAPLSLCDVLAGIGFSGAWGADGQILFSSIEGEAIYRVSANGGVPTAIMKRDPSRDEARLNWPFFLPDGRRFLYLQRRRDGSGHLMLADLGTTSTREVMPLQSSAQYVDPGYLLFASEGALLGRRFDLSAGDIVGAPFSIAAPVSHSFTTTVARFAASPGALVYQSRFNEQSLEWFDRSGRQLGAIGDRAEYQQMRFSPDGRAVAFSRLRTGAADVWLVDLERRSETRLTFGASSEGAGPWSPDGKTLFFNADLGAPPAIFRKNLTTGAETPALPATGTFQQPEDVSPDGKTLLYTQRAAGGNDIWMLALDGTRPPSLAIETPFDESSVRFSPDGRYFSFGSTMSGAAEIYLSPFPPTGEKIRVSSAGGTFARWNRNGRELLYQSADSRLMAVAVQTSPSLRVGTPTPLFELALRRPWYGFEVAPDGRILAIVQQARARDQPLTVVLNWTAELPK